MKKYEKTRSGGKVVKMKLVVTLWLIDVERKNEMDANHGRAAPHKRREFGLKRDPLGGLCVRQRQGMVVSNSSQ